MTTTWFVCQEDNLIAALPTMNALQQLTGLSEVQLQDRVHLEPIVRDDDSEEIMTPEYLTALRPFAMVWSDNPQLIRSAAHNSFVTMGDLTFVVEINHAQIEAIDATLTTEAKRLRWAKDKFGSLVEELFTGTFTIARQTEEIDWRSIPMEYSTENPAHIQLWCRFSYGVDAA